MKQPSKLLYLLLVDLDGTIRETISGAKFINHPQDQQIIISASKALAAYHQRGYKIAGIIAALNSLRRLRGLIRIDEIEQDGDHDIPSS